MSLPILLLAAMPDVGVGVVPPDNAVVLVDGARAPAMRFDGAPWPPSASVDPGEAGYVEVGGGSGDLLTTTALGDCRLHVEWYAPPGGAGQRAGNSGVYIQDRYEIQVLGTAAGDTPPAANEAGAIYGVKGADHNASTGPGTWQAYDIRFRAPRFEGDAKTSDARITVHWNGVLVHDDIALPHPTGRRKGEGESPLGVLRLQDHTSAAEGPVRYRNVWVAPYDEVSYVAGEWTDPLAEADAWMIRGGAAVYTLDDGELVGETRPRTPNTFYTSRATYRDFELTYEARTDPGLNSGVQIRSHVVGGVENREGGLSGYQVELDPSDRAWSAGLYDERRRAWLHPLHVRPGARSAFRPGAWNAFRVVAQGPVIRTWINGVPAAIVFDAMTAEGHFGFQVHGVGDRDDPLGVRFRDVRLRTFTPHGGG